MLVFSYENLDEKKNLTGKQLAKLMRVSQQQISRYETGKTPLTLDQLHQLLSLLDKSWVDLILFVQNEKENENNLKNEIEEKESYSLGRYLMDFVSSKE
ncbi:helix-turn-helix domain-containing protein [Providencia sp. PROV197]|uniref:helix-turn-helix domain-containing protein n=1 Tax=Providencia sp. PROV197 TaxID=2949898 RepID=UPI00234AF484|nr:helix-turn-helix transcriptional regulator [Providencia sp. PROV197]